MTSTVQNTQRKMAKGKVGEEKKKVHTYKKRCRIYREVDRSMREDLRQDNRDLDKVKSKGVRRYLR